jgi:hypothetical protein
MKISGRTLRIRCEEFADFVPLYVSGVDIGENGGEILRSKE